MNGRSHKRFDPGPTWWREALRVLAAVAVFVALILWLRPHLAGLEAWLDGLGPWAPAVFVVVHVILVSAGFPVSILGFVAGATFGLLAGTGLLLLAGLLAASVMFGLSRRWFADRVRRFARPRPRFARFLVLAEADAWRLMVLMRFSPLHYATVCYLLGASRVRFWPYLVTSACLLPSAVLQAYLGWTARRVGGDVARGGGLDTIETILTMVGVLAAVALLAAMSRLARRALSDSPETADGADGHR